jgi:hypothetical protein
VLNDVIKHLSYLFECRFWRHIRSVYHMASFMCADLESAPTLPWP